ncbi:MAG: nucleotidyltransferase family protein [Gemmatimonadota bacterium]|nr:nucleotidyltransferase family protein [Gemmatimonadota bacterium]
MVDFDPDRLAQICREHGVSRLRLFGSASRGEERADSDVDLIASFSVPTGYFSVIRLEDELSAFFGRPVDLLTEGGLSPYMRDDVLASSRDLFHDAA